MKKSKILTALLLSGLASASMAQSSVTVYGIIDLGLSRENNSSGIATRMESGVLNGSRFGLKGTEDLGGGLAARFQIEGGINADDGSSAQGGRLFGRTAWVGFEGGFGQVRLGRQYTPIYLTLLNIDPFGGALKGDMASRNWFNNGGARIDNTVAYYSPTISGFSGSALYGVGEVPGNNSAGRTLGLSLGYSSGPVVLAAAYNRRDNATATDNERAVVVGGSYDFGLLRVHAAYDVVRGSNALPSVPVHLTDGMIGVSAPVGPGRLMASYIRKNDKLNADTDANQWAVGYTYDLSKRTALYTSYATARNQKNSRINTRYNVNFTDNGGTPGTPDKVFDIGIRHSF